MKNRKPIRPSLVQVVALSKPIVNPSQKDFSDEAILWGAGQDEPLRMVEVVRKSKTASLCIEQISKYTFGDGFSDEDFGLSMANKDETFNQLLQKIAQPMAMFNGFALNIKYTILGDKVVPKSFHLLPFENVRLRAPEKRGDEVEKVLYNPYYGTSEYRRTDTKQYYLYNPDNVINEANECLNNEEEYLGQVLYYGEESEYSRFYPTPYWWSDPTGMGGGKIDMENEFLLTRLLNSELGEGFLQNSVIKMVGDPSQPIEEHRDRFNGGESYTTVGEDFAEHLNQTFSGVEGDKVMVLWSEVKEQFPEIEAFKSSFNYEKLKDVEMTVANRISAMFLVPPILAGIMGSGSISADDIQNAAFLMWSTVRTNQMTIQNQLQKVIKTMPQFETTSVKIKNYNPFPQENKPQE